MAKNTLILYEAPHKLKATLKDLVEITGKRKLVLARELTKLHEEFIFGTAEELLKKIEEPKGEFVIVIEKAEIINEDIFKDITLDEHYKYYENLRVRKKGNYKANSKGQECKKE